MTGRERLGWTLFFGVVLVILVVKVIYACVAYDDWTCAVAHCVKIK